MENFKKLVMEMMKEYIEKDGNVSCEFSTNEKDLAEKLKFLNEASDAFPAKLYGAYWELSYCKTCKGHSKDTPFHVQIKSGN